MVGLTPLDLARYAGSPYFRPAIVILRILPFFCPSAFVPKNVLAECGRPYCAIRCELVLASPLKPELELDTERSESEDKSDDFLD